MSDRNFVLSPAALLTAVLSGLAVILGSAAEAGGPRRGGEIRVAINSDILSLNPGVRRDGNTDTVLYHVGEALVAYRDDMTVAPMLAASFDISQDRRIYTFHLREGVKFHNGETMTANDVVWSWRRLLDPKTGFRCLEYFDGSGANGLKIESVEALDDLTVEFELNIPSALFLDRMANIQCLTAVLHPSSVDGDGEMIEPVGTGPFKVDEWKRGQYVRLTRFEAYAARSEPRDGLAGNKTPYVDAVKFIVTPDRIAAKASVYAGGMDLVFAVPLNAVDELRRRERKRGDVKLYKTSTFDWTVILMQSRDPLLSDPRMRRAVAHALSIDLATEIATYGLAEANPSAVPVSSAYYQESDRDWLGFNPELARKIAAEAGYRGETLTIQTNRKFSYMYDNAVSAQAMLAAAGFKVKIEVSDWATQLSNFLKGDFQLSAFGYSARSHPALAYGNFTGSKDSRASFQWELPEAMELVGELETAYDEDEIRAILRRLHELMIEDVPLISLYNDEVVDLAAAPVMGYEPWAFGRPRLWGVWLEEGGGE